MGTVSIQPTDERAYDGGPTAIVILDHGPLHGQEVFHVQSNAAIEMFNAWIDEGYKPISEMQAAAS